MPATTQRIAGLDGLRALSVLAVFAHHTGLTTIHGGFMGVDVFFVLSGFLITRLLNAEYIKNGSISFSNFYLRRVRRLYPALMAFLVAIFLYWLAFKPSIDIRWETGPALLYFMNWVRAFGVYDAPLTGHTWSLAIEEQFYLLWPLILLACLRFRVLKPVALVGVAVIAAATWRIYLEQRGVPSARLYSGFDTHSDGLLVGAFFALASPKIVKAFALFWKVGLFYLITCVLYEPASRFASTGLGFFLTALSAGLVIAKVVSDQDSVLVGVLSDKWLMWMGTVSYGFYLWHYAVIHIFLYSGYDQFGAFFGGMEYPRLAMFFACFFASLIPTVLSWVLVESPILARGSKKHVTPDRVSVAY